VHRHDPSGESSGQLRVAQQNPFLNCDFSHLKSLGSYLLRQSHVGAFGFAKQSTPISEDEPQPTIEIATRKTMIRMRGA
jgi:hypothetical protein